ncbi:MAG: permease prefix domain 1-containing protein [Thermoanaerobaculia bacterium]
MIPETIPAYVRCLRGALSRRLLVSRRLEAEVEEHLLDARDEGMRLGMTGRRAEEEALRRLGPPEALAQGIAAGRRGPLETTLLLVSLFTMSAAGYLTFSIGLRRPPGLDLRSWLVLAATVLVQGAGAVLVYTLAAPMGAGSRVLNAVIGCIGLIVGGAWFHASVVSPAFEGYAVVLSTALVVQSLLTTARSHRPARLKYTSPRSEGGTSA